MEGFIRQLNMVGVTYKHGGLSISSGNGLRGAAKNVS
jgi:hypothetical protein